MLFYHEPIVLVQYQHNFSICQLQLIVVNIKALIIILLIREGLKKKGKLSTFCG